jgi:uncharacterized protein involved in exopolysaccharide biosynthesis
MDKDELMDQIVIEPDETGTLTLVHVTANEPQRAADIANTLLEKASLYFGEVGASSLTANKRYIRQQLDTTKAELDEARTAMIQFRIENRLSSLNDVLRNQEALISDLRLWRDRADAEGREDDVRGYDKVIAERERELQGLILLISEHTLMQEDVSRIEGVYSTLVSKETEATLKENEVLSATYVQVLPAREPRRPLPLVTPKALLLGAVVSLALGIILAFVLHAFEHADVTADQDSVGTLQEIAPESSRIDAELERARS